MTTADPREQARSAAGAAAGDGSSTGRTPSTRRTWRGRDVGDWVGLLARLVLGGSLFIAGLTKIGNLEMSVLSVRAYQLLPFEVAKWVGYALPPFEILLGLMIMLGFLTRWTSLVGSLVMVAFIIGISSVWARGISIDCGCFGTGGLVDPDKTQYPFDLARDALFLAAGLWLVIRPRSAFAVDNVLLPPLPPLDDEPDDAPRLTDSAPTDRRGT